MTWPMADSWWMMNQGTDQAIWSPRPRRRTSIPLPHKFHAGEEPQRSRLWPESSQAGPESLQPGLHSAPRREKAKNMCLNETGVRDLPTHVKGASQAASPAARQTRTQRSFPGRGQARTSLLTTARTEAKTVGKVTKPKPKPLCAHTSTDDTASFLRTESGKAPLSPQPTNTCTPF